RHTRFSRDWSSDVCSSDLKDVEGRITELREMCRKFDRPLPRLSMNIRLFLAKTDEEAWKLARSNPDYVKFKQSGGHVSTRKHAEIGRASCRERVKVTVVC